MTLSRHDQHLQFPRPSVHHLRLTNPDYELLIDLIGPYHGRPLAHFLATATIIPNGRRLSGTDDDFYPLIVAIGCEIHGYRKIEEERTGKSPRSPKRGSTVARLLTINDQLEELLS
jgi:hypothetical protein